MSGFRMSKTSPSESSRTSQIKEPKKLLLVFTEGVCTEQNYFRLLSTTNFLNNEVELKVMNRLSSNIGLSNPLRIIRAVEAYMACSSDFNSKDKRKLNRLIKNYRDNTSTLNDFIELSSMINDERLKQFLDGNDLLTEQIDAMSIMLDYNNEYDIILLVFDRDKNSLTDIQYDQIMQIASQHKYLVGISNPTFELFLLLHLTDLSSFDQNLLKENRKTSKTTYTERMLKETLSSFGKAFKKNNYDAEFFIERFEEGLHNSQKYASDVNSLKDSIGTNLFKTLNRFKR